MQVLLCKYCNMANRKTPSPELVADVLKAIRHESRAVDRAEERLAEARARRAAAIRAALEADVPPTHAQISEASGLQRGQISSFRRR
jgi:hypothetical protein